MPCRPELPPGITEAGLFLRFGPSVQDPSDDSGAPDGEETGLAVSLSCDDSLLHGSGCCSPPELACTPPAGRTPRTEDGNNLPPADNLHINAGFRKNLQGPEGCGAGCALPCSGPEDSEALPIAALPPLEKGLPHDLGHDMSPSLSDPRCDMHERLASREPSQPINMAICDVCGEELADSLAIDAHIRMHHPPDLSVEPSSPPGSPSPVSPYIPSNPDLEPSESPPPTPDPMYPFVCVVCKARYKTERGLRAHRDRYHHFIPLEATVPELIGIPSGGPSRSLLHLLLSAFTEIAKQLPPTDAVARLLSTCRKMEGSGRFPPSRALLRRGLLGRAWQVVQSEASPAARMPEPIGEERAAIIRELHPLPPNVSLPVARYVYGPDPKINGKALVRELKAMKDVAAGPSGLGKRHLLYLCEKAGAAEIFADALKGLFSSCSWEHIRPLCEFRLRLLPKPNGKWRPIAVQETLLVAFHRLLLRQAPALRRMPSWQLAFESLAQVKAIHRAEELKKSHHLLAVDVKNAFNSVPHSVILFSLCRAMAPRPLVLYIASFLQARHSQDLPSVPAGVPQGDPLSMAMFCLSLIWPVDTFLSRYRIIAYADDIVVAFDQGTPLETVREDARSALARIGLTVEGAKCTSTLGGGISFMGTRILREGPFNLAETATRALGSHIRTLQSADLTRHDRLRLLVACVVPSVNYGPLIDEYPGPQSYGEIDALVVAEIGKILGIQEPVASSLALTPRSRYGLGLVLPHHYHGEMQEQRHRMEAGTFRELRRRRLRSAAPLRSFLPLALMRGPPLNNDQVLYIGECLSGLYKKGPVMGVCAHCRQPMRPRHHLLCKSVNGVHVARHGKILDALVSCAKGRIGYVVLNASIPINHLQPDLILGDGYGDLVVTVPWRVEKSYALKMAKYKPLIDAGRAAHILPVVIGTDGTVHPESAAGLVRAGVDLPKFLQEAASVILWHYTQSAVAFSALGAPAPPPAPVPAREDLPAATPPAGPDCPPQPPPPGTLSLAPPVSRADPSSRGPIVLQSRLNAPRMQHSTPCHDACTPLSITPTGLGLPSGQAPPEPPSVEVLSISGHPCVHTPSAPDTSESSSCFQRSRAPSPPPLDETCLDGAPAAEPTTKALPSIFKRVAMKPAMLRADGFYPFKRIAPPPPGGPGR
ncbi:Reverse transcriptase/endonuclease [Giardia lamblia P15]|uniref:Reverse transcriptase/endonuclease n=2 Tax=Giardia intestinalis (strain P15) TaxID=658858 RepID=E1EVS8_GIAIA|nr:Reverse transcriptase/endonuclease [Giardia lamblia P15]